MKVSVVVSLTWNGSKVGQSLLGYSLSLCSIFIPAYLVGRTRFEFKVCSLIGDPILHWKSHLFTEGVHFSLHIHYWQESQ